VLLVGCGSSDSSSTAAETTPSPSASSPSATSTTPAGCDDVAALKTSMQSLAEIRPLQDGLDATEQAVTDAKDSLEKAVSSMSEELKPAVDDISTAFAAVQTAVDGLTKDNIREQAPAIATALQGLGAAVTSLATTLTQECPQ